jgi:hypothetical protein
MNSTDARRRAIPAKRERTRKRPIRGKGPPSMDTAQVEKLKQKTSASDIELPNEAVEKVL